MNSRLVLIIEDEDTVHALCSRLLHSMGHKVISAKTLLEGRRAVNTDKFDLIITDLKLPDGDGTELIGEFGLKQPDAKILIITGSLAAEDYLKQSGILKKAVLLKKPFQISEFSRIVADMLV